ncbi:MAG: MFS transporter [Sphingomonadales bacterium]
MRWYHGWKVLAVTVLFQAILIGSTAASFTLLITEWSREFKSGIGDLQLAILIFTAVQCLLAPLPGMIVDRASIRTMIVIGTVSTAAGMALLSTVTAVWQILVVYGTLISVGVLLAGLLPAQTLAVKWFRGRRGLAIGLSTAGASIGGIVMPIIVTKLFLEVGWRDAHLILAAAAVLLIVPAVWLVVRNSPEAMGIEPEPESPLSAARAASREFPKWTIRSILRERTFWIMVASLVPMAMAMGAVQQNIGPLARDVGVSPIDAAFLVSVFSACALLSKILVGLTADRVDLRLLFWITNSLLIGAVIVFAMQPAYWLMMAAAVLLGLGGGAFLPLLASLISTRFGPQSFGQVMSMFGPVTMLNGAGPWIAGRIRDATGDFALALNVFLVILIPAMLAMLLLRPAQSNRQQQSGLAPGE